uniref:Arf-GAP with coiled-coil, ANK repeat and PH domain-containing protein n=1 Tax=Hippocampus comes TaxID=109280 RepID=A0A3Q2XX29_HIPCM
MPRMTVDFEECVKDSPRFRANIEEVETEVVEIEAKLDKLVKLCGGMIDAGKAYVSANKLFIGGIRDLSQQCEKDEMISSTRFESLQTPITFNSGVADSFRDVRKFKETRKHFERVREDVEIAQVKNAQAPRTKAHEVEEATCALSVARKCFRHLALDYVLQKNLGAVRYLIVEFSRALPNSLSVFRL